MCFNLRRQVTRLDPGGRRLKQNSDRERSLVYSIEKRIIKCIQSREQRGTNVIGS